MVRSARFVEQVDPKAATTTRPIATAVNPVTGITQKVNHLVRIGPLDRSKNALALVLA
jgi:hypothetical protein